MILSKIGTVCIKFRQAKGESSKVGTQLKKRGLICNALVSADNPIAGGIETRASVVWKAITNSDRRTRETFCISPLWDFEEEGTSDLD